MHDTALYDTIQLLEHIRDIEGNPYWNIDTTTAALLQSLITDNNFMRVLELGTSNGLSALYIAVALQQTGGRLITVESHAERFALATKHFGEAQVTDIVTQVKGHAPEVLDDIPGTFDCIFIDATSVEYALYYEHLKPRLSTGGILVADNVLSHQEKIQPFIDLITADPDFDVSIEKTEKGLLIATKVA